MPGEGDLNVLLRFGDLPTPVLAIGPTNVLLAVSLIVLGAALAGLLFRRARIPDVPFLLILGGVLGPLLHMVDTAAMAALLPLVGALAVVIIVFDGALLVRPQDIREGVGIGALLALLVLVLTTVTVAVLSVHVLGIGLWPGVLLGMTLGGAGIVIILPLVRAMEVHPRAVTLVTMEAVASDLLVIVGVSAVSAALVLQAGAAAQMVPALLWTVASGGLLGTAVAFGWAWLLRRMRSGEYITTLAVLVALYAVAEQAGGGVVAVLAFGIVIGNSRMRVAIRARTDYSVGGTRRPKDRVVPVFGGEMIHTHHDMVFLVRAFFFVGLGAVIDWQLLFDPLMILVGALLGVVVATARTVATYLVVRDPTLSPWDREGIALMFPLGLVTAVASVVPQSHGVPGTEVLPTLATLAILATNLFATLAVVVRLRARKRRERGAHGGGTAPGLQAASE